MLIKMLGYCQDILVYEYNYVGYMLGYMLYVHNLCSIMITYQCGLDPIWVANEILHTFIHECFIMIAVRTLVECNDVLREALFLGVVLVFLGFVFFFGFLISVFGWFDGHFHFEFWFPCSREDTNHQTLEVCLDYVHHVWAEIPDHVELGQDTQW